MGITETGLAKDVVDFRSRNGTPLLVYNWAAGGDYPIHGAYLSGEYWILTAWQEDGRAHSEHQSNLDIDFEQTEVAA
ncbi:MAG: hypothetical protein A3F67_05800 [Verrucomicrobia bacterium RIFCSPHIGHO2_12_FULL_41_10]|nr:MAG: hypothetical protein A3F67_05800 [Verrucomicrobia bacterium RIFCSPHIGHO2_12_FULL_41_10]